MSLTEMFSKAAMTKAAEAPPKTAARTKANAQIKENLDLLAEIAKLKAENDALKAAPQRPLQPVSFKVSEKGAVSVYGLGRFPTTLYASQWARLQEAMPRLEKFIIENKDLVKTSKED